MQEATFSRERLRTDPLPTRPGLEGNMRTSNEPRHERQSDRSQVDEEIGGSIVFRNPKLEETSFSSLPRPEQDLDKSSQTREQGDEWISHDHHEHNSHHGRNEHHSHHDRNEHHSHHDRNEYRDCHDRNEHHSHHDRNEHHSHHGRNEHHSHNDRNEYRDCHDRHDHNEHYDHNEHHDLHGSDRKETGDDVYQGLTKRTRTQSMFICPSCNESPDYQRLSTPGHCPHKEKADNTREKRGSFYESLTLERGSRESFYATPSRIAEDSAIEVSGCAVHFNKVLVLLLNNYKGLHVRLLTTVYGSSALIY